MYIHGLCSSGYCISSLSIKYTLIWAHAYIISNNFNFGGIVNSEWKSCLMYVK